MDMHDWLLPRAMPAGGPMEWDGAVWIGCVDSGSLVAAPARILLGGWEGETTARILVRDGLRVRGFVIVPVSDGSIEARDLRERAASLPAGDEIKVPEPLPSVTIVIPTRQRTKLLLEALGSIRAIDYPHFDVVVVENSDDPRPTLDAVAALGDGRVRCVVEPVPGVSRARNTGVRAATGDIIVFIDDDILADPGLLTATVAAFRVAPAVGIVNGLVPSGELRTPTQAFFDQRVTWQDTLQRQVFSMAQPPAGVPLFPLQVGIYGTGACCAVKRDVLYQLGGFDEALGVGSRTGGGEDIDLFLRCLLAGWSLVVEPSAIVWHRHRWDQAALEKQARGYGRGLGAFLTKIALNPMTAVMGLRRGILGARRLRSLSRGSVSAAATRDEIHVPDVYRAELGGLEVRAMLRGPIAYAHERVRGARAKPLQG